MPLYTYECDRCGRRATDLRPVEQRHRLEGCGDCGRGYLQLTPSRPAPPPTPDGAWGVDDGDPFTGE